MSGLSPNSKLAVYMKLLLLLLELHEKCKIFEKLIGLFE